jgi:glycosyltransferase involved in cell wall biosynthesis
MNMSGAKPRRRVALIGSFAPSLINFRGPLIAALVERGHEVHALAPDIDPATAASLRALGAQPRSIGLVNSSLNPLRSLRTIRELRDVLQGIDPDTVIAYTIKPIVLGAPAAAAAGVPRFIPLVTGVGFAFTPGREAKRRLSRLLAKLLYRRAFARSALAIFQNPDDRDDFRRLGLLPAGLDTALVGGSGVDVDQFAARPVPARTSFLLIARLLGDKGIREYGEAARRLKSLYPDVRMALVGYPIPSPDALRADEIERLIAGGVDYVGRMDDVRPALEACSVYVLPSYREGTPRSVLEAMSVGRAIITTDAPGCRETVVDGENGILVKPRDPDSLFEAMLRFVEEPGLAERMGASSRRLAEERFDVRKVTADILRHAGLA